MARLLAYRKTCTKVKENAKYNFILRLSCSEVKTLLDEIQSKIVQNNN